MKHILFNNTDEDLPETCAIIPDDDDDEPQQLGLDSCAG